MYGTRLLLTFLILASLLALPVQAELLGSALEQDIEHAESVSQYQDEIVGVEEDLGAYDADLIEPLMALARSQYQLKDYDAATESIRRAQHLSHRHEGVHAERQLEGVELMTRIHLAQGKPMLADKQQRFAYYVATHAAEENGLERLPAIDKLAGWYAQTGQLQRARKLTEQGINIIEQHFGLGSIEQLPYLQQLAKLKRLQRVCCSTRIMEQALTLIENNSEISSELKASTYVDVADAYTISGKDDQAALYYEKAWSAMSPIARQETFGEPRRIALSRPLNEQSVGKTRILRLDQDTFGRRGYRQISQNELILEESLPPQEFFVTEDDSDYNVRILDRSISRDYEQDDAMRTIGKPFMFLHKQLLQVLPTQFHRDELLNTVEVELVFDVDARGRTQNIKTINDAALTKLQRLMRDVVRRTRFRPRMEDGALIATENYRVIQKFPL
jgi:tetratricopeptide (TPR) repeat protein